MSDLTPSPDDPTEPDAQEDAAATTDGSTVSEPRGRSRSRRFIDWLISANPFTVSVLSLLCALVVGAILIVVSDRAAMSQFGYFFSQPSAALSSAWQDISAAYSNLFKGALFDPAAVSAAMNGTGSWSDALFPISETLKYAAPLIFTGLSVAFAFRGGLFNIGPQGQAIFGAIGAGLIGFGLDLPIVLHLILALIGGVVGGALWGGIAGELKARTGAHEVIVTIMLNYIALLFLAWFISQRGIQAPNQTNAQSKDVHAHAQLPPILGKSLNANLGFILGLLAVLVVAWLLNRSTFGFELRAVGSNPDAARTAGMNVGHTYTRAMLVAGALAGLGGATVLLGTAHNLTGQIVGTIGFDGITVALLGRGKPWGVVAAALLFGGLAAGGNRMQSYAGVSIDLISVLQAVIVILIVAPRLIRATFRLRAAKASGAGASLAKGW